MDPSSPLPGVSVIMTVLNGARHLGDALACVTAQDYQGELEVVVAVGRGRDDTMAVARRVAQADPRILVIENPDPRASTPAGLNAALRCASMPVVVRVDGHAMLPPDYVSTAVRALTATGADNVGGVMAAEGVTVFEKAVARAMTTRLGVGNAPFHTGGEPGPVDSVYLGVFRRDALDRVGGYDEVFARAQDWELNHRIRSTGGTVWFEPALRVLYRPRSTARALASQYFHYGRWRRAIIRRDPGTASLRYLAPPAAVVAIAASTVVGLVWAPALGVPAGYVGAVVVGAAANSRGLPGRSALLLPVVYALMHGAWGVGFLTSPRSLAEQASPAPQEVGG